LEASFSDSSGSWLVLEDIPNPLPREHWFGDSKVVAVLARLHSLETKTVPMPNEGYSPQWDDDLTDKMLVCFETETARQLQPILRGIQQQCHPIFNQECCISGDPNPGNWGVRRDGSLVLFDWERFTRATPMIDLAIIVAGLGNREQFEAVASTYLQERAKLGHPYWQSTETLAKNVALAKVWVVVEYLSLYTDGTLTPEILSNLTQQFIPWLASLSVVTN
jgi:thiamine kinase-like enzyme